MALTDYPDTLRVSNDEGWYGIFGLTRGLDGDPPWLGLPEWRAGAAFNAASACVYARDLYVARPGATPSAWVSAAFFENDTDITGLSHWMQVGWASEWTKVPYDLTDAVVEFSIRRADASATILADYAELSASSAIDPDELLIVNATAGGIELAIPPTRTRSVPAGLYRYDVTVVFPGGRRERARYGTLTVDQGTS